MSISPISLSKEKSRVCEPQSQLFSTQNFLFVLHRNVVKGLSTLAFFASVSPSAMAPLPNSFLCFSRAITYVIMQRKQLGGNAIADGETDAKNASVDGP
jgi:hypothetical protein